MRLSIILPAYNEEKKIKQSIKEIQETLGEFTGFFEIIIVNDGSKDNTHEKAKECASLTVRVLTYDQNRGKGYAIRSGMKEAKGKYCLFMDVDLSTSLEAIPRFLDKMEQKNCDVIVGTRKSPGANLQVKQPFYRIFLGNVFTSLAGLLTSCPLSDFTCGFKMYTKEAARLIFDRQRIFNWAFDAELIFIAARHKLRIEELPVTWRNNPDTKVRLFRDITTSLLGLIAMRFNDLRGFYR